MFTLHDGVRLHYEVHGPEQDPGRVPLVLSHGFSATAGMWDPNIADLAADRRVVVWDMRGHGRSDASRDPAAYTPDVFADDLAAVLDAAGAPTAVLGGMSLGGYVSLTFAARHPDRVRGLVLVDTGPGFRNPDARARWNERAEAMAEKVEADGYTGSLSAEVRDAVHEHPWGLALAARGVMRQEDSRVIDSLPAIAVPVLCVVGSRDTAFLGAAEYMARKVRDGRQVVIDGAGHAANIDDPAAFATAVRAFLDRF
jgi:pimeloyl-ACP methyl ester carboxylesterase